MKKNLLKNKEGDAVSIIFLGKLQQFEKELEIYVYNNQVHNQFIHCTFCIMDQQLNFYSKFN